MICKKCSYPNGVEIKPNGIPLDPCQYRVTEIHKNVTVEISRCTLCGAVDISWRRQDDTEDVYLEEETDD